MKTLAEELKGIPRGRGGELSPAAIVEWAKDHPDSALYADLRSNADVSKAVHDAELRWAGKLIHLHIIREERTERRVEIRIGRTQDCPNGGARPIGRVMADPVQADVVRQRALGELRSVYEKYRMVWDLSRVWVEIERAIRADKGAEQHERLFKRSA